VHGGGGGREPSLLDAVGTSAAAKTSRPWRSMKEEAPDVMVSVAA
jgi:hypothetical protein